MQSITDMWTGIKLKITILNSNRERLEDTEVIFDDIVGPLSSFDYMDYRNSTRVHFGDIGLLEMKEMNLTFYPKISGPHVLEVHVDGRNSIYDNYDITIRSGLNLTYFGHGDYKIYCPKKEPCWKYYNRSVNINDDFDFTIRTNNSRGYVGEFGISTHLYEGVGFTGYTNTLDGRGWLNEEDLVEATYSPNELGNGLQYHSVKVSPKMSGQLVIIPFAKVDGKVLLFERNEGDEVFMPSDDCRFKYTRSYGLGEHLDYEGIEGGNSPYANFCINPKSSKVTSFHNSFSLSISIIVIIVVLTNYSMFRRNWAIKRAWKKDRPKKKEEVGSSQYKN